MNAKIAVNHETMGRVWLKNPTHLPIHHVPPTVFKVCTGNIRHRMLAIGIRQTPHHDCTHGSIWFDPLHKKEPQPMQKHD